MSNAQQNPQPITVAGLDALQLTQTARGREWEYDFEQEAAAAGGPVPLRHFGPLATELQAVDPPLVRVLSSGDAVVDSAMVAGLAWAAAAVAGDRIATLTLRVAELERQLAELT